MNADLGNIKKYREELISKCKSDVRNWVITLEEEDRKKYAQNFIILVMKEFWLKSYEKKSKKRKLPELFEDIEPCELGDSISKITRILGSLAAQLPIAESCFIIGSFYTSILPTAVRATNGVFYTPPTLTNRLIELADKSGVDWKSARIIDPACGGGAFLAPICERVIEISKGKSGIEILNHIQTNLIGWEIDPFAGWLSQVFVEVVLKDILVSCEYRFKPIVSIGDSLKIGKNVESSFDLVIGNPPYGKVKSTDDIRSQFRESLFGHPNYYGIFKHLALQLCSDSGIVAFLTPTSFLSGEYFKKLRSFIKKSAAVLEIDFVSSRKNVFEDVLQETLLVTYKKKAAERRVKVNEIVTGKDLGVLIHRIGQFSLPKNGTAPWILPRSKGEGDIVKTMNAHVHYIRDWGYEVKTGPLVWNRHKMQLTFKEEDNTYPIVWAEAISSDGRFSIKSEKANHKPYFRFENGDEWLVNTKPCILLQRTTAKEQDKRLIAALLPEKLRKKGVVVENHLNMIIPFNKNTPVSPEILSIFLNSKVVNQAFRTISGSVAVSAYEIESLPLPPPESLILLKKLVSSRASSTELEAVCEAIYKANYEPSAIFDSRTNSGKTAAYFPVGNTE